MGVVKMMQGYGVGTWEGYFRDVVSADETVFGCIA